jgi:hypothetical protein
MCLSQDFNGVELGSFSLLTKHESLYIISTPPQSTGIIALVSRELIAKTPMTVQTRSVTQMQMMMRILN